MKYTPKQYKEISKEMTYHTNSLKNCVFAFLVGGAICTLGQALLELYKSFGLDKNMAATCVSISLIFLSVLLTSLNIYDKIAKYAGAGTLVPITGFANAMSSAAITFKAEGYIMGVGAKMFTIAGPVIVYGISAAALYGVIYYILTLI